MNIESGHDRYGHFVMFDGWRAAMPSAEVARLVAAVPGLLEVARKAAKADDFGPVAIEELTIFARAMVAKATR